MSLVSSLKKTGKFAGLGDHDALRVRLAEEIEERIAILDALDGDPDMEPNGDEEPSLGWTHTMAMGDMTDLEEDRHQVGEGERWLL